MPDLGRWIINYHEEDAVNMVKGDQSDNVREEQGSGKVHYTKAEMVQMVEKQVKRL